MNRRSVLEALENGGGSLSPRFPVSWELQSTLQDDLLRRSLHCTLDGCLRVPPFSGSNVEHALIGACFNHLLLTLTSP